MWPMKNISFILEYSLKSTQDNLLFFGLSTEGKFMHLYIFTLSILHHSLPSSSVLCALPICIKRVKAVIVKKGGNVGRKEGKTKKMGG